MHPHSLTRLLSKVYNTPHLITPQAFNVILDYFDKRNAADFEPITVEASTVSTRPAAKKETLGYLSVDGSLTYRPVMTLCGEAGTSYQSLVEQTQELADAGVKRIVMEINSGGGEASHVFQAANDIRTICDDNEIELIGYADTLACSAAYALGCVCDQLIANPSADIGSIGCVVALLDTSKAMEKAGFKRIFITSGENKVPFDADGSFKESFLEDIQADVDRLNDEFAAHVSKHTGIDVDTIKGLEAKVFHAEAAKERGLVNAVMTNKEFGQFLAQLEGNE